MEDEYIDPRPLLGAFASDLHFPRYRKAERGPWSLRVVDMRCALGYWGEVHRIHGAVIMTGPSEAGTQSWMSMLPSEIESQEIGLRSSHGHTVVFGLGMGWLCANVALRPEVERVTVVERDPEVIALIESTGVLLQLPPEARRKITLHCGDALQWHTKERVDTLQIDIWRRLVEPQKLDDVRRMQANVEARSLYFWGQEMEIWRYACRRAGAPPEQLDWADVRAVVDEEIDLPLILANPQSYPQQILQAAPWWTPAEAGWWRA